MQMSWVCLHGASEISDLLCSTYTDLHSSVWRCQFKSQKQHTSLICASFGMRFRLTPQHRLETQWGSLQFQSQAGPAHVQISTL